MERNNSFLALVLFSLRILNPSRIDLSAVSTRIVSPVSASSSSMNPMEGNSRSRGSAILTAIRSCFLLVIRKLYGRARDTIHFLLRRGSINAHV